MKKHLKYLGIAIIVAFIYINMGRIYQYRVSYAMYYPRSTEAYILLPMPSFNGSLPSPFSSRTPTVNPILVHRGYETFYEHYHRTGNYWIIMFWPIVLFLCYVIVLVLWLAQIAWWIILAFVFVFDGSLLRWIGLIP